MFPVSRETEDRLRCYVDCLRQWNAAINLMSARDLISIWPRHIHDGLALASLYSDRPGTAADIGSGAGIPGLIAAIASDRPVTLVESDRRKAAFLIEAARVTQAPVTILATRAEDCSLTSQAVISARALAPLTRLLTVCQPMLAQAGRALLFKGQDADLEIEEAGHAFRFEVVRHLIGTSLILEISNLTSRP